MTHESESDLKPEKSVRILLASSSASRKAMLSAAKVTFEALPARIDEEAIRQSLEAEGAKPRDVADTLAEMKAAKLAGKHPDALVIGSDQVLELKGRIFSKPESIGQARDQLKALRGQTHRLLSAAVVFEGGRPVWRHVSEARLTMREFSDDWLEGYLQRNQAVISTSVGGYLIEAEGVRLFSAIQGDHFTILGMPLVPLLSWLSLRGSI